MHFHPLLASPEGLRPATPAWGQPTETGQGIIQRCRRLPAIPAPFSQYLGNAISYQHGLNRRHELEQKCHRAVQDEHIIVSLRVRTCLEPNHILVDTRLGEWTDSYFLGLAAAGAMTTLGAVV